VSVKSTTPAIRSPFKGLTPFDDSDLDAQLFFGRERETEIVVANVLAARLTVLYGPSGVGKSSLLRAGVAQRLRRVGETEPLAVAVFSSWSGSPLPGIEEAARAGVADALGVDPGDAHGSTADRVDAWTAALGGELCLILDQLEEFFLYHGDDAEGRAFADQLADLVTRPRLRVNVLLGIRDDALARLDAFKSRIPGLFANSLRLDRLDRDAARTAVLGPLQRYNELASADAQMSIEPALLEAVLAEVAAGRIDPGLAGRGGVDAEADEQRIEAPYLQLVLQRLWEVERERGSGILRLATFRELGGAERMVEDHLERAMAALSPHQRDVAAGMFDHLVTPSGMKIAHGVSDLATYAHVGEAELAPVVTALAGQRILRPLGEDGEAVGDRYEIFHDVLADAVLAWRTRHEADAALLRERTENRRRQRRLGIVALLALLGLALMGALTVYAFTQRSEAQEQAERAQLAQEQAEDAGREAVRQRDRANREAEEAKAAKAEADAAKADAQRNAAQSKRNAERAERNEARAIASEEQATALAGQLEVERDAAVRAGRRATDAAADATAARRDAEQQAKIANRKTKETKEANERLTRSLRTEQASALTAQALSLLNSDPDASLQLVVEAAKKEPRPGLESATRNALLSSRVRAIVPAGPGEVTAAETSANGTVLLAAGEQEARFYHMSTPTRIATVRHGGPIETAALSRDGRTAATLGEDRRIRIWNVAGGRERRPRLSYPNAISDIAFSPDGTLLAAAGADGAALLWRLSDGRRLHRLVHPRAVEAVSFSPNGRMLLTLGGGARLYEVPSGRLLHDLRLPNVAFDTARLSPDGTLVVTGGRDDRAHIWSAQTGERLRVLEGHGGDVSAVAWSPDGRFVATGSSDSGVRVFTAATGVQHSMLARHVNQITSLAFSPEGAALVSGSLDGTAVLWSGPFYSRSTPLLGHMGAVRRVGFLPDGRALTAGEDGSVRLWTSRADPELVGRGRHAAAARAVAASRDGRIVVTAGADRTAVLRRPNGAPVRSLPHPATVNDVAISRDSKLVLTGADDGIARLWRTADGRLVAEFPNEAPVRGVAIHPRGELVATAGTDGIARVFLLRDPRRPPRLLRHGGGRLNGVAFGPDGRTLATAGEDADARIWRVADGRMLAKLDGHEAAVTSVAYSPDGRLLLTASTDADLRLWNVRTRSLRRTLRGHSATVSEAAFSPDGRWIASAGPITVGLWETQTGRRLDPGGPFLFLRGHPRQVRAVAFVRNGRVASVGDDGSLRTYDCEVCGKLPSLVRLAQRRLDTLRHGLTPAERSKYLAVTRP
jgi:WD40 repeat protein